jgi:hypothetical protein
MLPAEGKGWSALRDGGSSRPLESVLFEAHDAKKAARRRTEVESFGTAELAQHSVDERRVDIVYPKLPSPTDIRS